MNLSLCSHRTCCEKENIKKYAPQFVIIILKFHILDILYRFGATQGSVIHYLIEIQDWEMDHNSLERHQAGPSQLSRDWLCVNTSFLIHRADRLLTGIIEKLSDVSGTNHSTILIRT